MRKLAVVALVFGVTSLFSGNASAIAGYVCLTNYFPGSGALGTAGGVSFSLYSSPDCTGSFIGTFSLCSASATSSLCPASSSYRYSEAELLGLAEGFREAAAWNYHLDINAQAACLGPVPTNACASTIHFLATPL